MRIESRSARVPLLALAALVVMACVPALAAAQPGIPTMSFGQYLESVLERNLDLAAATSDVTAAHARVDRAARLPDPRLWGGISQFDISHPTGHEPGVGGASAQLPTSTVVQLDVPIELGDRQGRRMDVARVGSRQADLRVEDRARTLRGQAAHAWIDALATRLARARLQHTLDSMETLVQTTEAGVQGGALGQVTLLQARVQAQLFRADVLAAEGEARAAVIGLSALLGDHDVIQAELVPAGDLALAPRQFDIGELVAQAMDHRPDLRVAALDIEAGRAEQSLAEADRWGDITVSLNWLYSFPGEQTQFAQTQYHTVGIFLGIPLPFRLAWHGEIDEAIAHQEAADARHRAAERRIEVELRQALARYEAAVEAAAIFGESVLADAESVLEAARYDYERGGSNLLAVLLAQRTLDEVRRAYTEAQAAHAHALVDLETAAGIWDVSFGESTPSE
jgi:cobalt-zinc-cadmium efflux system outer membrane protein